MRRRLHLSLVLCVLIAGSITAQYSHFPFDTDEKDALQNINSTATASGVSYVADAQRESVMELDGTDGFVTFTGNDAYDFDALTYNIWFQWNHPVADQWWVRVFDFGIPSDLDPHPGNHDVVFLTTFQDGRLRWHIHSVTWEDGADTVLSTLEQIATNEWYMLTCTHNVDSAKLYLDGVLQDSRSVNGVKPSDLEFTNMYLGKSNWPDLLFMGRMDDFGIYDVVLTAEEISDLYIFPEVPDATTSIEEGNTAIYSYSNNLVVALENTTHAASLKVYNLQGIEVISRTSIGNYTEINAMESGIYIVKVFDGVDTVTRKVLIQ